MAVVIGDGLAIWVGTLFAVTPVGLAVGIAANIIYDSNFLGIKDMSDDWANNFDKGVKKAKEGLDNVGEAVSKSFDNFVSSFSW